MTNVSSRKRHAFFGTVTLALGVTLWPAVGGTQLDRGEPLGTLAEQLALGPEIAAVIGPPRGDGVSGKALDRLTDDISARMRCPVCQGHAVDDSPAEAARSMKQQVRAMLAAGYHEAQIFQYFEASYGEFVRLIPKAEGFNLLVWLLPFGGMVIGIAVIWTMLVAKKGTTAPRTEAGAHESGGDPDSDLGPRH